MECLHDQALVTRLQLSTGRWTKEEHERFLTGVDVHGKNWGTISSLFVPSRTVTQIRTHAQKYFKKADRGLRFPREAYQSGANIIDATPPSQRVGAGVDAGIGGGAGAGPRASAGAGLVVESVEAVILTPDGPPQGVGDDDVQMMFLSEEPFGML